MSNILRGFVLTGLLAFLSACAQYQDNSLITDAKADECPPGCASSLKADSTKISIKILNNTIILRAVSTTVPQGETRADVSGDCYASLYPRNVITVKVLNTANTTTYSVPYYGLGTDTNSVSCINGRFNFVVDMSTLAAGGYTIAATMTAYDAAGTAYANVADGTSYITVRK